MKNIIRLLPFLFVNILMAQSTDLFNLTSSNSIEFIFENKNVINLDHSELDKPIGIKVLIKNISDNIVIIDNFELSYPLLNDDNLLYKKKGFSYCIFDTNGIRISTSSILYQPALSDSLIDLEIIDSTIVTDFSNQNNTQIKNRNTYKKSLPKTEYNQMQLFLKPDKSFELQFLIYLHMSGEFWIKDIPLSKKNKYYLKLYYSDNKIVEQLPNDNIQMSVSDKLILNVK